MIQRYQVTYRDCGTGEVLGDCLWATSPEDAALHIKNEDPNNKILSVEPISAECLKSTLAEEVHGVLAKIEKLFAGKNEQYRTENDDLANFTTGAMLRYGKADMPARFEALKDYVEKHIAKVYNSKLDDDKIDESIMDIAVYFVIAMVMHKRMLEERGGADE